MYTATCNHEVALRSTFVTTRARAFTHQITQSMNMKRCQSRWNEETNRDSKKKKWKTNSKRVEILMTDGPWNSYVYVNVRARTTPAGPSIIPPLSRETLKLAPPRNEAFFETKNHIINEHTTIRVPPEPDPTVYQSQYRRKKNKWTKKKHKRNITITQLTKKNKITNVKKTGH